MAAKRGRKSASELSVVSPVTQIQRLEPPDNLTEEAKQVFHELVSSVDPDHFACVDLPVLVNYCETTIMCRNATTVNEWEKLCRLHVSLATRLRLTPASRYDPKRANRSSTPKGVSEKPWSATG